MAALELGTLLLTDEAAKPKKRSLKGYGSPRKGNNYAPTDRKEIVVRAATSSIPTNYQTVFIDNSDKKGFGSQAKRFPLRGEIGENDAPGPGTYVAHGAAFKETVSQSARGTGGLACRTRRSEHRYGPTTPAANAYSVPTFLEMKRTFNTARVTSNFHTPIAGQSQKLGNPPPNVYEVDRAARALMGSPKAGAESAFRSKTKREGLALADNTPSPGQYKVSDKLIHSNPKIPVSIFTSKTKREVVRPNKNPGPGDYHPYEFTYQAPPPPNFIRRHYLAFSAPAMELPPTPPEPGPGAYDVAAEAVPIRFMTHSMFVSGSSRWCNNTDDVVPSPGTYNPRVPGKQSFHFNHHRDWIHP